MHLGNILLKQGSMTSGHWVLAGYNVAFIIPLVAVFVLFMAGVTG